MPQNPPALQSTFMRLVEAQLLFEAARRQLKQMDTDPSKADIYAYLHQALEDFAEKHTRQDGLGLTGEDWKQLRALASPELLTVRFNSW